MVLNSADYFHLHRASLARRAAEAGWTVDVLAGDDGRARARRQDTDNGDGAGDGDGAGGGGGVAVDTGDRPPHRLSTVPLSRDRVAPAADWRFARAIAARSRSADVVHLLTIKPVLYGLLSVAGGRRVVATHPGLGRVFDPPRTGLASTSRAKIVEAGLRRGYRRTGAVATFENAADRDAFVARGIVPPGRAVALAGAGLDLDAYPFRPPATRPDEATGRLRVLFASRWLRRKGLDRVLELARLARKGDLPLAVSVAGWAGPGDEDAVPGSQLEEAERRGEIALLGRVSDMPELLRSHDVLLAPSRLREGLPRVVLEAMAVGTVVVAPRTAATAALIEDGASAVAPASDADATALLDALATLADPVLRARLAGEARRRVEAGGYGMEAIGDAFLALYRGDAP